MNRKTIFSIAAVIGILFGLCFMIVPDFSMGLYGVKLDVAARFITRYYGTALAGLGIIVWLMRKTTSIHGAVGACSTGGFIFSILGLAATLWDMLAGTSNNFIWVNVAIYILLIIGFGFVAFRKAE